MEARDENAPELQTECIWIDILDLDLEAAAEVSGPLGSTGTDRSLLKSLLTRSKAELPNSGRLPSCVMLMIIHDCCRIDAVICETCGV